MRFWSSRRRRAQPPPSDPLFTQDLLRRELEDVLSVREAGVRDGIVEFRGALVLEPSHALDLILDRFRRVGYTPIMRRDGRAGVVVQAWPLAGAAPAPRIGVNVLLFALTCATTLLAGFSFTGSPTFDALRGADSFGWLLAGVPFAATLLAILGTHEFGHYFSARYHGASVSLPYFIPAPPPFPFGTLGAIIRMWSPPRDRNALFDIAVAGPLAGLVVALPAILVGLEWSRVAPEPPGGYLVFGESLLLRLLVYLRFGALPEGTMLYTHPVADAAWTGLLVTALNLFPMGQLDGGRIAYALFGERHRLVGGATFAALLVMFAVTWSLNWLVWAALLFFFVGFRHSPPLDDVTPLSPRRRALGFASLVLLILLIPPVPLTIG
jgi:membrane-associated protease RseP (regulator of RpoE activity)